MNENLLTYRLFRAFKKAALEDPSFQKRLLSLSKPASSTEEIKTHSTVVIVDPEWVNCIETKLPFLVNAVAEERQFVRSEGEVLPIERVRNISKESIEDLSKHANYLSHDPSETNGKIIPDRLLVSKKENDYKVYENRFLYTCLIYLNQFVEMRLNEIIAVSGRYDGRSSFKKLIQGRTETLEVSFDLHETRLNDPLSSNRGGSAEAIRKISAFLATTRMLLTTPLMKDVSSAPLVKPPITKTNIIRFDPNFKEVLELYHFLHSYDKKGYEIQEIESSISPFKGRNKEDFSLLLFVNAFLTYVYGSEIDTELHLQSEEFDRQEEKAKLEEARKALVKAKRELEESHKKPEEYLLLVEEAERVLERALMQKEDEIAEAKREYNAALRALARKFDEAVALHEKDIHQEIEAKEEEMKQREEAMKNQIEAANEAADQKVLAQKALVDQKEAERQQALAEKQSVEAELAEARHQYSILEAEVLALKSRSGIKDFEAMDTKEKFAYLDAQKKAFDSYYKKQWALTKKAIRKEAFSAPDTKSKQYKKQAKLQEEANQPLEEEAPLETPVEEAPSSAQEESSSIEAADTSFLFGEDSQE